jgi:periplasmic protein TonB
VSYPPYRPSARGQAKRGGPSLVSLALLVTVPALFAAAALRPR